VHRIAVLLALLVLWVVPAAAQPCAPVGGSPCTTNWVVLNNLTLTGATVTNGTFNGPTIAGGSIGGTISGSPTWSGNHIFSGLAQFSPSRGLSGAVIPSFLISENFSGSALSGQVFLNEFAINTDTVDASTAAGGGLNNFYFGSVVSAGAVGGRTGVGTNIIIAGPVTTTSGNPFYVSLGSGATAAASAGGTSGAGNARGNLFAGNDGAALATGAGLYWNSVVGREIDIGVATGTGAVNKQGFKVVQYSTDAVNGTTSDYGMGLANQASGTAPGWTVGFTFGSPDGWWPIKSTGTLIGTYAAAIGGGPSMAAANGIDFSALSLSGFFLKGPSSNFVVTGGGLEGIGVAPASALALKETGAGVVNFGQLSGNNAIAGFGITSGTAAQVSAANYTVLSDGTNVLYNGNGSHSFRISNVEYANVSATLLTLAVPPKFASSTTGAATQTFTNSPCAGTTTAKWIPVQITGQTGTWNIPACQ
jgi:hypothetical protein